MTETAKLHPSVHILPLLAKERHRTPISSTRAHETNSNTNALRKTTATSPHRPLSNHLAMKSNNKYTRRAAIAAAVASLSSLINTVSAQSTCNGHAELVSCGRAHSRYPDLALLTLGPRHSAPARIRTSPTSGHTTRTLSALAR